MQYKARVTSSSTMGSRHRRVKDRTEAGSRRVRRVEDATTDAGDGVWDKHVRLVGLCFAITFASLYPQIRALVGPRGVFPAAQVVALIGGAIEDPFARALRFPTLFHWVPPTAAALEATCAAGGVCGAAVAAGTRSSRAALLVAVACFLSVATVGGEFLAYPWDSLLLETGFLALLVEPVGSGARPAAWVAAAHRCLAFRLIWGMGLQKFYGVDRATSEWWNGTYLTTFYHWQPMPTPLAFYAHGAPPAFHAASCAVVGLSQCALPLLFFFRSRALRRLCLAVVAAEQVWIQATGNYGVFNVLTVVVCAAPLLDGGRGRAAEGAAARLRAGLALAHVLCGAFFLARRLAVGAATADYPWLSASDWLFDDGAAVGVFRAPLGPGAFRTAKPALAAAVAALRLVAPFRACNDYGIFRTGAGAAKKYTIGLEGAARGRDVFEALALPTGAHCATGGALRPSALPGWFAPHQPRLDHSFFYAGLGTSIARAVAHEQHHLAPIATPSALLAATGAALLDGGGDAASLFAAAPDGLDRLNYVRSLCVFGGAPPPPLTGPIPWACERLGPPAPLHPLPPDWLRARARALRDGLAREAALERAPPGALLALAAAAATAAFLARGSVAGTGGGGSPN